MNLSALLLDQRIVGREEAPAVRAPGLEWSLGELSHRVGATRLGAVCTLLGGSPARRHPRLPPHLRVALTERDPRRGDLAHAIGGTVESMDHDVTDPATSEEVAEAVAFLAVPSAAIVIGQVPSVSSGVAM